jgi:DNA-binding transcriptional regulator YiaG
MERNMSDSYASRILAARQAAGIGQRRFARLIGVRVAAVQNWERERRAPHERYQQRLETVLRELEANHATPQSGLVKGP